MEAVEKQSKWIAIVGTLAVHSIILFLFIAVTHTTPIPPYPEGTSPGIEVNFGNFVEGTGNVEDDNMGNNEPAEVAATQPNEAVQSNSNENNYVTNDAEQTVALSNKPVVEKNNTEVKPVEPEQKASAELLNALKAFKASKNKKPGTSGGGDGNSGNPGNDGDPNGNPNTHGKGGSGGDEFGVDLKGRKIIKPPDIADDSQEEGKVVVAIVVDASGKVISAEPGQRGSTTTASILWTKARQAALSTKFNPSPDGVAEQRGTITIVFALSH